MTLSREPTDMLDFSSIGLSLFFPFSSKSRRPLIYNLLFNHLNSLDTTASAQNNDRTTNEHRTMMGTAAKSNYF
jgi:hypothetical protein